MSKCTKCRFYTKYNNGLCTRCHSKKHKSDSSIKGRLAETIVEEMFIAMGYDVFRFGMENTLPGFANRHLPKQGEIASHVRKMPDFITVKGSQIAFIEVKYRTNGKFDFREHYSEKGGYPTLRPILYL